MLHCAFPLLPTLRDIEKLAGKYYQDVLWSVEDALSKTIYVTQCKETAFYTKIFWAQFCYAEPMFLKNSADTKQYNDCNQILQQEKKGTRTDYIR